MPRPTISPGAVVLAAGFLVLFIGGGARFAIGLSLSPMVDDLGWGRGQVGAAVAVFQIVSAVGLYLAGVLADRLSPRFVIGAGLAASAAGIGFMGLASEPWHAIALYGCLFGVGNGLASLAPVAVLVTRAFPGRAGFANAVAFSGMSVGQLLMIAGLAVVLAASGWRSVFFWVGATCLATLPLLFAAIPGRAAASRGGETPLPEGSSVAEAVHTRRFWLLLALYAACGFGDFFVTTHVAAFAQDKGLTPLIAGNLLALMGLTGLIGVVAAGAWSDRSGPVWPAAACFVARVAVFSLVLIDSSPVSVAIFALVFGLTFLVTAPLTVVFVREAFGLRNLGALTGLITMVHHIFGGFGAYLGASVFDATRSYEMAFVAMLAASAVALASTMAMRPPSFSRGR